MLLSRVHAVQRGNRSHNDIHLLSNQDLTCDQVLVLVDVELDAAQTLGGVCVDVLHMLNFVEAFVHLQDTRNNLEFKKKNSWKKTFVHPLSQNKPEFKQRAGFIRRLCVFCKEFLWREGVQSSALH